MTRVWAGVVQWMKTIVSIIIILVSIVLFVFWKAWTASRSHVSTGTGACNVCCAFLKWIFEEDIA
jgi:hypothetical protein